jgi:hypothetical protein
MQKPIYRFRGAYSYHRRSAAQKPSCTTMDLHTSRGSSLLPIVRRQSVGSKRPTEGSIQILPSSTRRGLALLSAANYRKSVYSQAPPAWPAAEGTPMSTTIQDALSPVSALLQRVFSTPKQSYTRDFLQPQEALHPIDGPVNFQMRPPTTTAPRSGEAMLGATLAAEAPLQSRGRRWNCSDVALGRRAGRQRRRR